MLDKTLTIFYTDCGGQPELHEVIPALLAGPTIFMLAFNLHVPLDSLYQIRYESSTSEVVEYNSCCTVKEVLMQCLSSILSFHEAQSKSCDQLQSTASSNATFTSPPTNVLALGTHKDLVEESQITKVDECLQECVAKTAVKKKGLIEYYETPKKLVIPIDNFSEEDGPKVREVFDRVVKREGKEGVSRYKIQMPAPWLALELCLRQQQSSVVSYAECSKLGTNLGIDEQELVSCLWFLHHRMGTIRYYGNSVKELEDIVITQPSVLFRAVTEFITSTFTPTNVDSEIQSMFYSYGLFKTQDVEFIFNKHKDNLHIIFKQFIALLNHLNIIGPAHNDEFDYFLPCALAHAPLPEDNQSLEERDPLLVRFSTGFVPKGMVSGLLARLCQNEKWEIECDRKGNPLLFRDQASFIAYDYPFTMKAKAEYLEFTLDYKTNGSVCNKFCTMRHDLNEAICNVLDRLGYTSTFEFGFYCSLMACKDSERHFAEALVEDVIKGKCSVTKRRFQLEESRCLWFKVTQVNHSQHSHNIAPPQPNDTDDILSKTPTITDAFNCLRKCSALWDDIALELEIERNDRHQLRDHPTMSANRKLESVLEKWVQGQTCDITWQKLIDAAVAVGRNDIAKDIKKFLNIN